MNAVRQHLLYKILTLTLVMTFLLPSAVKFMHIFEHHQHEVCYGEIDAHFHTLDVDCEFYKFQLNPAFTIPSNIVISVAFPEIKTTITTDYSFLSDYQRLHFSLRGPPAINLI